MVEGHGGEDLEGAEFFCLASICCLDLGLHLREKPGKFVLRDELPLDSYPLAHGVQMWRGVESGSEPRNGEGGGDHRRGAPLSL